jgi:hypothetical protein
MRSSFEVVAPTACGGYPQVDTSKSIIRPSRLAASRDM